MPQRLTDPLQPSTPLDDMPTGAARKRWEIGVFLMVVAVIIPLLTFFSIATYALAVWIAQMLWIGPPGPLGG